MQTLRGVRGAEMRVRWRWGEGRVDQGRRVNKGNREAVIPNEGKTKTQFWTKARNGDQTMRGERNRMTIQRAGSKRP